MNEFSKTPSTYEGLIIEDNHQLRETLKKCIEMMEQYEPVPGHAGGCSPPMTPCDGSCMDLFYFNEVLNEAESLIKTEI
jgi:hypothetical protein